MNELKPFLLRIPPELFAEIQEIALEERRSANAQIIRILEQYIQLDQSVKRAM